MLTHAPVNAAVCTHTHARAPCLCAGSSPRLPPPQFTSSPLLGLGASFRRSKGSGRPPSPQAELLQLGGYRLQLLTSIGVDVKEILGPKPDEACEDDLMEEGSLLGTPLSTASTDSALIQVRVYVCVCVTP